MEDRYKLDTIQSKEDFIPFMSVLVKDYEERHDVWENNNLKDYLRAMSAYLSDAEFTTMDWKSLAQLLLAASVYE